MRSAIRPLRHGAGVMTSASGASAQPEGAGASSVVASIAIAALREASPTSAIWATV
jgi:hypothetical protein